MLNNIRRKVANKIHPEPSHDYPFVELNWKSDEDQIREGAIRAHKFFEEENGRKATSDDEAREYMRNYVDNLIAGVE